MILDAVTSYDIWIWHALFGMPGTNNDLNVSVNGTKYNFGYYLADGIYPNWSTFKKAIRHPFEEKNSLHHDARELS